MAWDEEKPKLMAAGFSEQETQNVALGLARAMKDRGNTPEEMNDFFGKPKEPDISHISEFFDQQFRRNMPMQDPEKEQTDPNTVATAVKAGLQNSVLGLRFRGELPNAELEPKSLFFEGAPAYQKAIQGVVQTVADLPVMGIGAMATPWVPTVGAFAAPQAMRAALMKSYEDGGVHSWSDFWDVAKTAAAEGGKGAIVGAATFGAGAMARAATASAGVMSQALAPAASELAAMTAAGAGVEGHMPEAKDFLDNALVVGGLHAIGLVPAKLRKVFSDTGLHPQEVSSEGINNPVLRQELLTSDKQTPNILEPLKQPAIKSDFVIADGKLVPGDKESAQQAMRIEPVKTSDFMADSEARLSKESRAQAARLHDPEVFKVLDKINSGIAEGNSKIESNKKEIEKLTEVGDEKSAGMIKALRLQNDQIREDTARLTRNVSINDRLVKAWEKGQKTLESNLEDRLMNKKIQLSDSDLTALDTEIFNPDFNDPKLSTLEMMAEAKHGHSEIMNVFYGGETRHLSREEILSELMKNKPDFMDKIAPELKIGARPPKQKEPTTIESVLENVYNDQIRSKLASIKLEKQLGEKLPFALKPEEMVVKSRDSKRTANAMIGRIGEKEDSGYGVFNPNTGKKTSDSLVKILSEVPKEKMDDFRRFSIYKHAIDLNSEGELTGVKDEEARAFVAAHEKEFGKIQKKFVKWNNALLQYAADGGLITQALANGLKEKYPNYVATNRLAEDMDRLGSAFKRKVVYEREGSELPFLDPIASAAEKAYNVARQVAENDAKVSMFKADALRDADSKLLREVGVKGQMNIEGEFKTSDLNEASFSKPLDERMKLNENQVGYFDDGIYKVMSFNDTKLANTLKFEGFDKGVSNTLNFWLTPLKMSASLARFGVSGGADFLLRHFFRSEISTSLVSEKWRAPIIGTLAKLGDAYGRKSDLYTLAERSGALHGVMTDIDNFTKNRDFVMGDKEGAISTAVNILKTPFNTVHAMMRIAEEAKRISGFEERLKDLGPDAKWSDILEAGWETRKDSVDGLQRGAKMQALNMITAFQHYEMQGLGRTVEAWQENPARMAARSAMMTGISALLWYSHHDDSEYDSIPNYEKNAFWHVRVGKEFLKVAKPWGPGYIFASLPERILDLEVKNNPRALTGFGETLASIIPLSRPTILTQWQALHDNYNTLTDRQIIPQRLMEEAPESRRMPYTSETAVLLSKALTYLPGTGKLNLNSPMMVDHAINMWTGQMGRIAVQAVDKGLAKAGIGEPKVQPVWNEPADTPFLGGFVSRHENYNAQPLKDFQEEFKTATQNYNTWRAYQKADQFDAAEEFESKHPEIVNYKDLQAANKMINEQGSMIRKINLLPIEEMSVTDRQQQIPDLWKTMIATAKTKLDEIDQERNNKSK